jgi:tRNA threonylcarbamoyladenosine modification (KEOPS) complex Cgi121 subunit
MLEHDWRREQLLRIDEYDKVVEILCYSLKENIDPKTLIEDARRTCDPVIVQLFDAETVAGKRHLFFGTLNAIKKFIQGRGLSQSLDIEILLCVSAQKQIGEAIRINGIQRLTKKIAVVLVANSVESALNAAQKLESLIPGAQDQTLLTKMDDKKRDYLIKSYGISSSEFESLPGTSSEEALEWLIVERTAILEVKR